MGGVLNIMNRVTVVRLFCMVSLCWLVGCGSGMGKPLVKDAGVKPVSDVSPKNEVPK